MRSYPPHLQWLVQCLAQISLLLGTKLAPREVWPCSGAPEGPTFEQASEPSSAETRHVESQVYPRPQKLFFLRKWDLEGSHPGAGLLCSRPSRGRTAS